MSSTSDRQRSSQEEESSPESTQRKKKPKRVRAPRPQEPDATAAVDRRGEAGVVPPCSCSAGGDVKLCQSSFASPRSRGLRAKLTGVGATFIVCVLRKRITSSDIDRGQHRLLLSKNLLNRTVLEAAMQVEEIAQAMADIGLPVRALDRLGREYELTLWFISSAKMYRIMGRDYSRVVRENQFRSEQQWIDVLVFRSGAGLGVALVEHEEVEEVDEDDGGDGEAASSCLCGNSTETNLAAALIMLSQGVRLTPSPTLQLKS